MADSLQEMLREDAPVRTLRGGWHEARSARGYVLARHWPPRFDVAASAGFPMLRRGRLARQVRQDLWRVLKGLRGFSPVIQVAALGDGICLTAGGRCLTGTPLPQTTAPRIEALLSDPAHRARWISWAAEGVQ
ncbi:hypothetical protein [Tropicibacter sp. S64]|uniref:hypothetical protein n=1 Tax=Tropicibacter sp. S64 TaxID=3415122 RepID=UPI003C7C0969